MTDHFMVAGEQSGKKNFLERDSHRHLLREVAIAGSVLAMLGCTPERANNAEALSYDAAVQEALELVETTDASDLYDCNTVKITPGNGTIPIRGENRPFVTVSLKSPQTELASTGYFSDDGKEVDNKKVEISWVAKIMANHTMLIDGEKRNVPGTLMYPDSELPAYDGMAVSPQDAMEVVLPFNDMEMMQGERESHLRLSVKYVNVGEQKLGRETFVDCGTIRTIVTNNKVTILGAVDRDGNPIEITA